MKLRGDSKGRAGLLTWVLWSAILLAACGAPEVPLESEPGRFHVVLPGVPKKSEGTVETAAGPRTGHFFHLSLVGDNPLATNINKFRSRPLSYSLSYVVVDEGGEIEPSEVIQGTREQISRDLTQVEGGVAPRVTERSGIALGTHPGEEFTLQVSPDLFWRIRVYAVNGRCYTLWVFGNGKQIRGAAAERFFDSFTAW